MQKIDYYQHRKTKSYIIRIDGFTHENDMVMAHGMVLLNGEPVKLPYATVKAQFKHIGDFFFGHCNQSIEEMEEARRETEFYILEVHAPVV